jgi:hypothetical protein
MGMRDIEGKVLARLRAEDQQLGVPKPVNQQDDRRGPDKNCYGHMVDIFSIGRDRSSAKRESPV